MELHMLSNISSNFVPTSHLLPFAPIVIDVISAFAQSLFIRFRYAMNAFCFIRK